VRAMPRPFHDGSVKKPPRYDPACLPSNGASSSVRGLATLPRAVTRDETPNRELARFVWFCRHTTWHFAFFAPNWMPPACWARWLVGARSPCTPRSSIDARRFFGPDEANSTSATCFQYDARTRTPRAGSSPAAGDSPTNVASHRCALALPAPSSVSGKRFRPDATQRATRISPTPGLDTQTLPAETGTPSCDTFGVGPKDMGTAQTESTRGKVKRRANLAKLLTLAGLRLEVPLDALSSPSCRRRCVRDGMVARSRACTLRITDLGRRSGSPPRRDERFRRPRCFPPWEPSDRRDRSLNHLAGPP